MEPEIWSNALHRLSEKVAQQNFEMWLRPIRCRGLEGQTLRLCAPNPYVRLWFESNYLAAILDEIRTATGEDFKVEFQIESEPADADSSTEHNTGSPAAVAAAAHVENPADTGATARLAAGSGKANSVSPHRAQPDHGQLQAQAPAQPQTLPRIGRPVGQIATSGGNPNIVTHTQPVSVPHDLRETAPNLPTTAAGLVAPPTPALTAAGSMGGLATVASEISAQHEQAASNPQEQGSSTSTQPSLQLRHVCRRAFQSTGLRGRSSCGQYLPAQIQPIFVCGGVGLGKTHLLHAIGHHILKTRPGARLLYLSGEQFMNEYIHAIRTNAMHEFRRSYREDCDVLLVDDVQFLAGKDGTQDEFFHTFNALHDTHRQIVLTADRKPYEISDIADRLRTRFAWGLLADIEPPELEVRVAILRKKAAAENIHLPDDVALYIAGAIKSNVRELEGALIRLAAYASLSRREINIDFAHETLEGSITRPPEHLTCDHILKAVAGYYNVKVSDLKSPRRHKSIAGPRAVAMYLARTHTNESYPDLGRSFGGKHHTTVISAVEKITRKLQEDAGLRGEVHAVESLLLR